MSSQLFSYHHHHLLLFPTASLLSSSSSSFSSSIFTNLPFFSELHFGAGSRDARDRLDFRPRCSAISKPRIEEYANLFHSGLSVLKWQEIVENDTDEEGLKDSISNEIKKHVHTIKSILGSMEDGEISISPYDTAWVALVEDLHGSGAPQFPTSLQWIVNNQLPDGSWGDEDLFSPHDRVINTLACVIALKSWNIYPEKCDEGMAFFKQNISKLQEENSEHMPIGFEVSFPSLLELAKALNLEVPRDSPVLKEIYAKRNVKLTRIPRDILHKVPTTLLHSLEGMPGLEWEKLMKLQSQDGSFLFSPSSTAFALIQTKDENCLRYLNKAVQRFNGGVPNVYPVDLFEHIWAVDRLERLGISRYFQKEIKECLDYVHRYWTDKGICWARNSEVQDIDDTAMGFRLLRLYGYDVSPDVFCNFEKGGEFVCFAGQTNHAVTGMFNLYRASQVLFPGEKILEDANNFSFKFLTEKREANQLFDKWIITKDLPGEVGFALDIPMYASLARVESRFYLEQYGGQDDVWIGKTLYRMPFINNEIYLELAKMDFNHCQALHRMEWNSIQEWYSDSRLGEFGLSKKALLFHYFLAAASIFEPERASERLGWTKSMALIETIACYFDSEDKRRVFVDEFINSIYPREYANGRRRNTDKTTQGLAITLARTLDYLSLNMLVARGHEIILDLRAIWKTWLCNWQNEGDGYQGEGHLLVQIINLSAGYLLSEETLSYPEYQRLAELINKICRQLRPHAKDEAGDNGYSNTHNTATSAIDSDMQELVQLVLANRLSGVASNIKETFLTVAKSFYYAAFCDPETINFHIAKVLFERAK